MSNAKPMAAIAQISHSVDVSRDVVGMAAYDKGTVTFFHDS